MKKFISIILMAAVLIFALAACGQAQKAEAPEQSTPEVPESTEAPETTSSPETADLTF